MTLKTFHFAGLGGMHTTEGVPRIKEIINAAKYISTPVITCELENKTNEQAAQVVKGRIEKTYLRDISVHIEDEWTYSEGYILLLIDFDRIAKLRLDVKMTDIRRAIMRTKGLKIKNQNIVCYGDEIRIHPEPPAEIEEVEGAAAELDENGLPISKLKGGRGTSTRGRSSKQTPSHYILIQEIMRDLLNVVVKGYPEANRAVIKRSDSPNADGIEELQLLVEGYGLSSCMATPGVNPYKTKTNSVIETFQTLGIEAARSTIFNEMQNVMRSMDIASHHIQLLADTMTVRGEVLGITRFGMAKSKDSVLQLASFEKTPDHLFEAGARMKEDKIQGVSESIIVGQPVGLGTGIARVYRPLGLDDMDFKTKEPLFVTAWEENRVATGWEGSYGIVLR
jgi:DNA-directed RNA polymerase III subunit RPC1